MKEQEGKVIDFKDFNWKEATNEQIIRFGKTTDFPERGISIGECQALIKALETLRDRVGLIIFETGMMFGTSTRIFLGWALKYSRGSKLYSCEIKPQSLFIDKMKEAGYWEYVNLLGNSQEINWGTPIDFLFIDSEHLFQDALGEYMRYRIWLRDGGIVGFHDTDNCTGVRMAIDIAKIIDELEPISKSDEASGIEFYKLKRKNVGGFYIRQLDYLKEEIRAKQRIKKKCGLTY